MNDTENQPEASIKPDSWVGSVTPREQFQTGLPRTNEKRRDPLTVVVGGNYCMGVVLGEGRRIILDVPSRIDVQPGDVLVFTEDRLWRDHYPALAPILEQVYEPRTLSYRVVGVGYGSTTHVVDVEHDPALSRKVYGHVSLWQRLKFAARVLWAMFKQSRKK